MKPCAMEEYINPGIEIEIGTNVRMFELSFIHMLY